MTYKSYILDSSVWIALFVESDSTHEDAVKLFESIETSKVVIPYCVILEVCTVLSCRHSFEHTQNFMRYIQNNEDIFILDNSAQEEMYFYQSLKTAISFTDVSLIFLAKKHGFTLVTFDRKMLQLSHTLQI